MNARLRRVTLLAFVFSVLFVAAPVRASPGEDRSEERYLEGDIDAEDFAHGEARGGSWVSLSGFGASYDRGTREVGAMAVVGVALDRVAARPPSRSRARVASMASFAIEAVDGVAVHPARRILITPIVARRAVAAAWRVAGLGADDARLEDMVSRAHWSSLLPETRLRAMRRFDDANTVDPSLRYTDTAHLWLEARMTWRLDRLLYVDDEASIERLRGDRNDARARIASRVLVVLAQWQRAWSEARAASPESPDGFDAALRVSEAESALEILTGGWFTGWRATIRTE
ncbi:MAG: hypothetical protein ABIP89_14375 [Polyangiaceae bacterium]